MRNIFHKISAIFLVLVLVLSSTTFNVNGHICRGSVYSLSIFGDADDCGMDTIGCENEDNEIDTLSNEPCCSDINISFEGSTLDKAHQINIEANMVFLATYPILSINSYRLFDVAAMAFTDYSPPSIDQDINVLYEVFLI